MKPVNIHENPSSIASINLDEHPEDYDSLKAILKKIDAINTPQAVFDGEITLDETVDVIDRDDNGLTRDDFLIPKINRSPSTFHRLDIILSKHHINLSSAITDWEYSLGKFVDTGEAPINYLNSFTFIKEALILDPHAI